jgi:hypothetical protein
MSLIGFMSGGFYRSSHAGIRPIIENMVEVPTIVWVVAAVATGFALLGFLNSLANELEHEVGVHDLRRNVIALRCTYLRRMIDLYEIPEIDDTIEVEIVDDDALAAQANASAEAEPEVAAAA